MRSPWFRRVTAGSAAGAVAREVDWAATPLGVPAAWPASLRVIVEMCFTTRFPVLVTWGPELTMIYNDGYRDMLGTDKHPAAMGAPMAEVWKEIWEDLRPSVEQAVLRGEPTWEIDRHLVMHRSGYDEDTYFTFSYSPIRDASDTVRGLLDIATETTEQVVDRRRTALLGNLAARLGAAVDDVASIGRIVAEVLGGSPDVVAADLWLRGENGDPELLATTGASSSATVPTEALARVLRTGTEARLERSLLLPLTTSGDGVVRGVAVLVAGTRRPWDDAYRAFLRLVAAAVAGALGGTLRRRREVDELRRVSDTLQAAILPEGSTLPGVVARYVPAGGDLAVGGDWYDVLELGPRRRALVVGDCVGHGLDAAARMGQLRAAARALLLEDADPSAVLGGLDRFAATLPGAECTTVFCGVVDEDRHTLAYAVAGHLPPVLRRADGSARLLQGARGGALGLGLAPPRVATEPLADGDLLVVCTDGLIERRGEALATGLDRLRDVVAAQPLAAGAAAVADGVLHALVPRGAEDDVALVVYRAGTSPT